MKQGIIFFLLFAVACSATYTNREDDKILGEQFTAEYFEFIKKRRYYDCFRMFTDSTWILLNREGLMHVYNKTYDTLGYLKEIHIENWQTARQVNVIEGKEQTLFEFEFRNQYERGSVIEALGFRKDTNGIIKLLSYKIYMETIEKGKRKNKRKM